MKSFGKIAILGLKPVDIWRRRATQLAPALGSEVAVADVVGEDEHDVGLLRLLRDYRHAGIVSPTTDASRAELICPVILIGLFLRDGCV
jgi:hypothetical protein